MKKFYITTSIPYVNDKPHMGHTLDPLYADVLARYYRKKKYKVFFLVGLDENGQKVYQKATECKRTTHEWISEMRKLYLEFHIKMNNSYDKFIRTSDKENHYPVAQEIWRLAQKNGDIYKKNYKGLYCVGCEAFKKADELVDGKCPDHLKKPEEVEEENYFFALSKYQEFLLNHFTKNKDFVYPRSKYNEAIQMIKRGLEDVSISRPKERLPWGVPVPNDEKHVMYVWFDALINYLSGIGFENDKALFKKFWPADLQIVGKDNNRWHTILWPAMLRSAGLALPKKVLVHDYILGKGGVKMSKTIGNVIDPIEVIDEFGTDAFRYYLLAKILIESDSAFDIDYFKEVYQSDLANGLGNLVQRTAVMIEKYLGGEIPTGKAKVDVKKFEKHIESLEFHKALEVIWKNLRELDQFIEKNKPWELAKINIKKLTEVLGYVSANIVELNNLLEPFLPETHEKIAKIFAKNRIGKIAPLFPRIEEK